ncbi:MAG: class I SAM-dependent methyltransferase [Calditrichaeota bacterium]|nr:class I SAM-dependent methyltransferase [Calditrichota bacterium]
MPTIKLVSSRHRRWERFAPRYLRRGVNGLDKYIARCEWSAAALLYERYFLPGQGWILDIGAGNGQFWNFVEQNPAKLILLDIAAGALQAATFRLKVIAEAGHLPVRPGAAEGLIAMGISEYIEDLETTLTEWRQSVKPGGRLLLTWSAPTAANYLRRFWNMNLYLRTNDEIHSMLTRAGWARLLIEPVRSGWQYLTAAQKE